MEENNEEITSLETLDSFFKNNDNTVDNVYFSKIPENFKEYPCILGIDEAGRGPVLGPMVYGIAFCPINESEFLISLGCDDSKALNEAKREEIFEKIIKSSRKIGWAIDVLSPNSLSNGMLARSKISLNRLSMDSAVGLLRSALERGVNVTQVFVDTVGPPEKYQDYLISLFPKLKITVSKKADSKFPIVSAASICAKVSRDHALYQWKFPEGLEIGHKQFGSGYPADPVTKKFLKDTIDQVFGYPQLVRFSWSTTQEALKNAYHVDYGRDDEDGVDKAPPNNTQITAFFKKNTSIGPKHDFFTQRLLTRNVEF